MEHKSVTRLDSKWLWRSESSLPSSKCLFRSISHKTGATNWSPIMAVEFFSAFKTRHHRHRPVVIESLMRTDSGRDKNGLLIGIQLRLQLGLVWVAIVTRDTQRKDFFDQLRGDLREPLWKLGTQTIRRIMLDKHRSNGGARSGADSRGANIELRQKMDQRVIWILNAPFVLRLLLLKQFFVRPIVCCCLFGVLVTKKRKISLFTTSSKTRAKRKLLFVKFWFSASSSLLGLRCCLQPHSAPDEFCFYLLQRRFNKDGNKKLVLDKRFSRARSIVCARGSREDFFRIRSAEKFHQGWKTSPFHHSPSTTFHASQRDFRNLIRFFSVHTSQTRKWSIPFAPLPLSLCPWLIRRNSSPSMLWVHQSQLKFLFV